MGLAYSLIYAFLYIAFQQILHHNETTTMFGYTYLSWSFVLLETFIQVCPNFRLVVYA